MRASRLYDSIPGDPSAKRLRLTVLAALLVHLVLILGIRFQQPEPKQQITPTLKVSLVANPNKIQPEEHVPEAAADHLGGGMPGAHVQERSDLPAEPATGHAAASMPASPTLEEAPDADADGDAEIESLQAPQAPSVVDSKREDEQLVAAEEESLTRNPKSQRPSATRLMMQARQLARLSTSRTLPIARGDAPKSHGASTRFSQEEAYIDAWVGKVQLWGTRNFPEEARRKGLTGQLRLNVILRFDGQVQQITLLRSSGHAALDDAAVRIVELAGPYAVFPETLRSQHGDFLSIDRDWQFVQGNRLTSR